MLLNITVKLPWISISRFYIIICSMHIKIFIRLLIDMVIWQCELNTLSSLEVLIESNNIGLYYAINLT